MDDKLEIVDRAFALLAVLLFCLSGFCQVPNDLCADADSMTLDDCAFRYFTTLDAQDDIAMNGMMLQAGFGMNVSVHSGGYDIWYTFDKVSDGTPLTVDIYGGECIADPLNIINYGEFQGWRWAMWHGPNCIASLPVWETNNAQLTDQWPAIVLTYSGYGVDESGIPHPLNNTALNPTGYYDPTRQVWSMVFYDAPAGRYHGNIRGVGFCRGEAWLRVCEGFQILGIDEQIEVVQPDTVIQDRYQWNHDFLGRRIE